LWRYWVGRLSVVAFKFVSITVVAVAQVYNSTIWKKDENEMIV